MTRLEGEYTSGAPIEGDPDRPRAPPRRRVDEDIYYNIFIDHPDGACIVGVLRATVCSWFVIECQRRGVGHDGLGAMRRCRGGVAVWWWLDSHVGAERSLAE